MRRLGRETWHPLKPEDAKNLTSMLAQFNSRSPSGQRRMHMTLYLWSRLWDERDGVPYFNCGRRTIAKECDLTEKAVRSYFERMEADGWIVRLGKGEGKGRYIRRTFAWLAPEGQTWPQEGPTLGPNHLQKGPTKLAPEQGKKGPHNMEHVNKGGETAPPVERAAGSPAEGQVLINAVTGERFEAVLRDPDEIGVPQWMQ